MANECETNHCLCVACICPVLCAPMPSGLVGCLEYEEESCKASRAIGEVRFADCHLPNRLRFRCAIRMRTVISRVGSTGWLGSNCRSSVASKLKRQFAPNGLMCDWGTGGRLSMRLYLEFASLPDNLTPATHPSCSREPRCNIPRITELLQIGFSGGAWPATLFRSVWHA